MADMIEELEAAGYSALGGWLIAPKDAAPVAPILVRHASPEVQEKVVLDWASRATPSARAKLLRLLDAEVWLDGLKGHTTPAPVATPEEGGQDG